MTLRILGFSFFSFMLGAALFANFTTDVSTANVQDDRAADRRTWTAPFDDIPDGAVIVDDLGKARLILGDRTLAFRHSGWTSPRTRPRLGEVRVLTPPTSVAALRHGFDPVLHPSALH